MSQIAALLYGKDEIRLSDTTDLDGLRGRIAAALQGDAPTPWVEVKDSNDAWNHILVTPGVRIRLWVREASEPQVVFSMR